MRVFERVLIPTGRVRLEPGGYVDAPTEVRVEAFAIGRYPVTNADFAAFVAAGGYRTARWWPGAGWKLRQQWAWDEPRYWYDPDWTRLEHPVIGVSWYEAQAYCTWLSAETGERVRLPDETQWQRAASGDDGREFPWGDAEPDATRCNWHRYVDETTPVTQYPDGASPYGVMDLSGNVWEWCRTAWAVGKASPDDPGARILRGGSWSSDSPISLRAAHRSARDPNTRLPPATRDLLYGFRVVWD
ncbi:MAG: formylglycine-generating enzyme family protein [Anaerolineae bacterium]